MDQQTLADQSVETDELGRLNQGSAPGREMDLNVIRHLRFHGPRLPAVAVNAELSAAKRLREAEKQAATIVAAAELDRQRDREAIGLELALEMRQRLERRKRRLHLAYRLRTEALCRSASHAVLTVSSRLWRQAPADTGPTVRAVARELLSLERGSKLSVEVNPADLPALSSLEPGVELSGREDLSPGDLLLVDAEMGVEIDARNRTRGEELVSALAEHFALPQPRESPQLSVGRRTLWPEPTGEVAATSKDQRRCEG